MSVYSVWAMLLRTFSTLLVPSAFLPTIYFVRSLSYWGFLFSYLITCMTSSYGLLPPNINIIPQHVNNAGDEVNENSQSSYDATTKAGVVVAGTVAKAFLLNVLEEYQR